MDSAACRKASSYEKEIKASHTLKRHRYEVCSMYVCLNNLFNLGTL